jgi:hypothetical protein
VIVASASSAMKNARQRVILIVLGIAAISIACLVGVISPWTLFWALVTVALFFLIGP